MCQDETRFVQKRDFPRFSVYSEDPAFTKQASKQACNLLCSALPGHLALSWAWLGHREVGGGLPHLHPHLAMGILPLGLDPVPHRVALNLKPALLSCPSPGSFQTMRPGTLYWLSPVLMALEAGAGTRSQSPSRNQSRG